MSKVQTLGVIVVFSTLLGILGWSFLSTATAVMDDYAGKNEALWQVLEENR